MNLLMRASAEEAVRSAGAVKRSIRFATSSRPSPLITKYAEFYTTAEFDAHFEFGLDALLRELSLTVTSKR